MKISLPLVKSLVIINTVILVSIISIYELATVIPLHIFVTGLVLICCSLAGYYFYFSANTRAIQAMWFIFLCIAIVAAIVAFFSFSKNYIGNDEGSYIYESLAILHGKFPIRDFITRAPFQILVFAFPFGLFGGTLTVLKLLNLLLYVCTGVLIYVLVRKSQGILISLLAVTVVLLNPLIFISKLVINTTSLSIILILLSFYTIRKNNRAADILTGIIMACAVFTREIASFYIIFLLVYLLMKKNYQKALFISYGGIATLCIVLIFFSHFIGLGLSVSTLLGVGHISVQEARMPIWYSLEIVKLTLISILPFMCMILLFRKKRLVRNAVFAPTAALLAFVFFYFFYTFKRGFLISYGSEILVPLIIVCFCSIDVNHFLHKEKSHSPLAKMGIAFIVMLCITCYTTAYYMFNIQNTNILQTLIGSGIPKSNLLEIKNVIEKDTSPDDMMLAGNLAFSTESNRKQFLDISRPMAYQTNTTIYSLYKAASVEDINQSLIEHPPRLIVNDYHLQISLWNSMSDFVQHNYTSIFQDQYATVWIYTATSTQQ